MLFHKNDLPRWRTRSRPCSAKLPTPEAVVGIVINAIDDSLSGPVQIAPDWNLEYLAVLRPLLDRGVGRGPYRTPHQ